MMDSFVYTAKREWNCLPPWLKQLTRFEDFKRKCRAIFSSLISQFYYIIYEFTCFLGSGPEGADDLCFHTGEISPFPPPSQYPPPSLQAHISASRPISQPWGWNPSPEAQIPTSRPKS